MGYFDEQENVADYINMTVGYDGRDLIAILKNHLPAGSTVLELGMGPGKDLDMLKDHFQVTGSDSSSVFIDRYKKEHPSADVLVLDAVSLETERTFDCIYSNKVLQHLEKSDLQASFSRQKEIISANGLLLHSFWFGKGEEMMGELRFVYYTEEELLKTLGPGFEIIAMERYKEEKEDDSFYILLRKE